MLKPDHTPLGQAGTFYLLDAAGEIARCWSTTSSSVQEHLSTSAFVIEDDALVCYFHDVSFGHVLRTSLSRSIELDGLRPLPSADAPAEEAVQRAIERDDAR